MSAPVKPALPARLHVFAPQWGSNIVETAAALGPVTATLYATPAEAYEAARADSNSVLMVGHDGSYDLVQFLIDCGRETPALAGLVVGQNVPVLAVKQVITLPRWDMVEAPVSADPLREALNNVCRRETAEGANSSGKCWTVTSSVGGAGATLMAVELAYQFSQREKNNRVCLVDLNFFDGSCASYLNCPSNLNQAALTQAADRIDDALLQAFITRHKAGIHILSAPRSNKMWSSIKPEAILKMLDVACSSYDMVIIDLPRWPTPWTGAVVTGSDEVLIVSELTVPALHSSRHRAEELEDASDNIAAPKIVLNRMTKKVFGNTVTVSQAEEAIGRPVYASISSDWDAALTAVNFGQAVGQAKPGNKISRDVAELIANLELGLSGGTVSQAPRKQA